MDVSPLSNDGNPVSSSITGQTLGKDDFLKLLTVQLSHQDPLNPLASTEFTAQLAQFSSLEELTNVNSTLGELLAFQYSIQNAMVTNLIGKVAKTEGNSIYLTDSAELNYELSGNATSVKISIYDGSGDLVRSDEIGPQGTGDHSYVWDGKDASGNQMPEGPYTYEIKAQDASDEPVHVSTSTSGTIKAVTFKDGITYLMLEGGIMVNLSEIQSIEEGRS